MRLVPVFAVGLCVCLLASILGCKPAKRPSGKPDPWDSLRVTGRLGEVVKERSPRPDWEEMRAEPESITFLWADHAEHSLIGLLVVAGTGEATYTFLKSGSSWPWEWDQVRATLSEASLTALWDTIEANGFLDLERSYYARDVVDGMALKIGIRGKGGQKLVYLHNYFPKPVREVTTFVIEEILGTAPPVTIEAVPTPDDPRWVPASSLKDVSLFSGLVGRARTRRGAPERPPSGTARTALGAEAWLQLFWVEGFAGRPRLLLSLILPPVVRTAIPPMGGERASLTYAAGEEAAFPVTAGTDEDLWKQAHFDVDGQTCLELRRMLLSTEVDERGGGDQDTGEDAARVLAILRTTTSEEEPYFKDFSCEASKPEVARIAKFLREKVIAPHAEEMSQARTLSPTETWTFLQLLKFAYP